MLKKKIAIKNVSLLASVFFCLVLVFWNPGWLIDPARRVFSRISYPFARTFSFVGQKTSNAVSLLASISELKKENEKLIKENKSLLFQAVNSAAQEKENELLRKQLELLPRQKYQLETAFVVGQNPRGTGSWIVIDKGRKDGIVTGMTAIVSDGILVGKVVEVYEKSSKISMLNDAFISVNVIDVNTGARGILSGEYGLGMTLGMVEQSEVLNIGDRIITSGLGGEFPKGLLVGDIQQIESTQDKLFQKARINPIVDYGDLNVVSIIKNSF